MEPQEDTNVPDLLLLNCTEGPYKGTTFSKAGTLLSVGRTAKSKICVKDPSISEKHAKFEWDGQNWLLQDLGSSNGTKVNGRTLSEEDDPLVLNDQDIIHFGDSKFQAEVTPVPAESVTVEQYLRAECHRYEARVAAKLAQLSNQLKEDWKAAKLDLLQEQVRSA